MLFKKKNFFFFPESTERGNCKLFPKPPCPLSGAARSAYSSFSIGSENGNCRLLQTYLFPQLYKGAQEKPLHHVPLLAYSGVALCRWCSDTHSISLRTQVILEKSQLKIVHDSDEVSKEESTVITVRQHQPAFHHKAWACVQKLHFCES